MVNSPWALTKSRVLIKTFPEASAAPENSDLSSLASLVDKAKFFCNWTVSSFTANKASLSCLRANSSITNGSVSALNALLRVLEANLLKASVWPTTLFSVS